MAEVKIRNLENIETGKHKLSDDIFGKPERVDILHRVVNWQLSKARSGCHKAKQRNEVSGSTRKIYKQKGTGQARHGSIKAPIFIGGGIVFGPVVRSHEYSLNKKVRSLGLKVALSKKLRDDRFVVVEDFKLESYKSASLKNVLNKFEVKNCLIIDDSIDPNLEKAASNLAHVNVLPVAGLNVLSLLRSDVVIITKSAVDSVEKRFA